MAWQVKVTLSPSRTERGSMDKVTVGGSAQETTGVQWTAKNRVSDGAGDRCQVAPRLIPHINKSPQP